MTAVLLRATGLDALDRDAEAELEGSGLAVKEVLRIDRANHPRLPRGSG
jgi:hypothetical protein